MIDIEIVSNMKDHTKTCKTCKQELPIECFGKRRYRSNKDDAHWIYSRYGECKECSRRRKALWRSLHPDYMKQWYQKNKKHESTK